MRENYRSTGKVGEFHEEEGGNPEVTHCFQCDVHNF